MAIETCDAVHVADWALLRAELWPDGSAGDHLAFAGAAIEDPTRLVVFLACGEAVHLLGFAEGSLRLDYVNGCSTSPVGFLEGIYVREPFRLNDIARVLVAAIEFWARERGYPPESEWKRLVSRYRS